MTMISIGMAWSSERLGSVARIENENSDVTWIGVVTMPSLILVLTTKEGLL